jgi:hypothetical protein
VTTSLTGNAGSKKGQLSQHAQRPPGQVEHCDDPGDGGKDHGADVGDQDRFGQPKPLVDHGKDQEQYRDTDDALRADQLDTLAGVGDDGCDDRRRADGGSEDLVDRDQSSCSQQPW